MSHLTLIDLNKQLENIAFLPICPHCGMIMNRLRHKLQYDTFYNRLAHAHCCIRIAEIINEMSKEMENKS